MKSTQKARRLGRGQTAFAAGVLATGMLASMVGPAFAETAEPLATGGSYSEQVLAKPGDKATDPVQNWYRIPALVDLGGGVILASYDGRPDGGDSPSPNSIIQRRSTDGGKTWGAPTFIARGQVSSKTGLQYGFSDPSYVYDAETDTVFNFHVYSKNQGFWGSVIGTDDANRDVTGTQVSVSTDRGLTWSTDPGNQPVLPTPTNYPAGSQYASFDGPLVTDVVKPAGETVGGVANVGGVVGMFASSGEGIQLKYGEHKGRLVQQFAGRVRNTAGAEVIQAYSVYSDDHGKTWTKGGNVGERMDENKVVELSNGDLMLNSRDNANGKGRKVTISKDGGQTWGPVSYNAELKDPTNNASIARVHPNAPQGSAEAKVLMFSNANSTTARENGTIRYSCDDGTTWSAGKQFKSGYMAYSTATALSDGTFGLLYEADNNAITFGKFDAEWLGVDCLGTMNASLTAANVAGANGATVDAELTVTNNGAQALSGAVASFTGKPGWELGSAVVPDIAAGASATVKVPVTIPAYAKAGSATLTASLGHGGQGVSANVPVTITGGATENVAGLEIKGSATDLARDLAASPYAVGEAVPYQFRVDSLSNVTASAVPVSGNFKPFIPADGGGNCRYQVLNAGSGYTCATPKHFVTADELADGFFVPATEWEATATGATTQKYSITGAEVDLLARKPSLSATHTGGELVDVDGSGFATPGDTISYTSVITNNGNVRLTGVTVAGQKPFTLAAGESKTLASVHTVTVSDVAANRVVDGLVVTAKNGAKRAAASVSAKAVAACSDALCGQAPPMDNLIPQDQLSIAAVSSEELTGESAPSGPATALLDGDINSYWHTQWSGTVANFPHSVVFDLGQSYSVTGLEYTQRQGGSGVNGQFKDYEIYVSNDPLAFGEKVASGSFTTSKDAQRIAIAGGKAGQYVKLVGLNATNGLAFGGGAEVNIGGLPADSTAPTVSATPGTVEAGKDVTVSVAKFPANAAVELALGGTVLGTATTDAQGNASKAVTVPAGTAAGSHTLTATSGATTATALLKVNAPAAVLSATIEGARADSGRDLAANPYAAGESLPYNFAVKNTSGATATVYPTSGELTGFNINGTPNCRYRNLGAGAGYTCTTAKRVVTAEDVANGFFSPVTQWAVEAAGSATVNYTVDGGEVDVLVRNPELTVTAGSVWNDVDGNGLAGAGDTVTTTATVTNSGNVALTGVAGLGAEPATLAVGESASFTETRELTTAEIAAGAVAERSVSIAAANGAKDASAVAQTAAVELPVQPATPEEPAFEPSVERANLKGQAPVDLGLKVGKYSVGEMVTVKNLPVNEWAYVHLNQHGARIGWFLANDEGTITFEVPEGTKNGKDTLVVSGQDGKFLSFATFHTTPASK
ncbi:sialidase-1 [Arthrobacter stackebrandtii]|uniref:exo-alpha-sialidase n=1 Tax=Arthrobacter stackebrandtii TaxID=272161 RepID=A0ABS4YX15_9MICC|nr:discoidin domain-containing protein [Arthrobacter stackebrandtii]MBP2412992.1 sialidase-1 [Arthrobacter stackebrandtii]